MEAVIINFSGRANGNCEAICQIIESVCRTDNVVRWNFRNLNVTSCGKCAYECFTNRKRCPFINDDICKIYDSVTKADVAYFVVPNYCDYPNAYYFIFNERSQCYFQGEPTLFKKYLAAEKKFVVVSNTQTENFSRIFQDQIADGCTPSILFLSAKKYGKISIAGDLLSSEEATEAVKNFCLGKKS